MSKQIAINKQNRNGLRSFVLYGLFTTLRAKARLYIWKTGYINDNMEC